MLIAIFEPLALDEMMKSRPSMTMLPPTWVDN
jgi:hypothetical protein